MSKSLSETPIDTLKGVGPQLSKKLAKLGIFTLQDLLFHLPLRYQDRTRITPIGALQPGQEVVIEGEVRATDVVFGRRRSLACRLQDGTGTVTLRFFHFSAAQKQNLSSGTLLRCFGEVRRGSSGLEIYHPEYRRIDSGNPFDTEERLTPIYPATEGVQQPTLRKLCRQALQYLGPQSLTEWLPKVPELQGCRVGLEEAVRYLHQPPTDANLAQMAEGQHPCQQRLAFEELMAHNLSLLKLRQQSKSLGAPKLDGPPQLKQAFLDQLPFPLTGAQLRVSAEIDSDIRSPQPMLRLVQGDVGSGKTVVAALAALQAIASGYQVAVMAPTEILAEQHHNNFLHWMAPLNIPVGWLSGKIKGKARQKQLEIIASGEAELVVGTHALFQEEVEFQRLGLIIIDEQHRFGVHQRLALKNKASQRVGCPHQLIMTATPIPRTLAMSAYADLDTSVIDELPPGRTPVNTVALENTRRDQIIERIRQACVEDRRQAYWVCTLIEESEALQAQAAECTYEELKERLPELQIGLVHGRLKADEKVAVMDSFKAGTIDLLVATTVIEVGVDVPNASLMIIDNPERLGLAQLHQLRGRVGRGSTASHCLLLYQAPLSQHGKKRITAMREHADGFAIAEIDLELRGPGEVLGTRQTGLMEFRVADLQRDGLLLDRVRELALDLLENHPQHVDPLIRRWLGENKQYAQV